MITLDNLTKELNETLNENLKGIKFNIVTDTADFKVPTRVDNEITEYVNGVITSGVSEITNLVSGSSEQLIYATQTATLRVIMPIRGKEEDREILNDAGKYVDTVKGYKTKLEDLKSVLNTVFQGINVSGLTDDDGKTFSVTTVYQFAESGVREIVPTIGDSFSFYINIYYSFIQNGINTRDVVFILDGVTIPYQSMTMFRTPTMDGNVYANTKNSSTKNLASQSILSLSFELPALQENTTSRMIQYLLDGPLNQAHILTVSINGSERNYLVTYGEIKLIGETIKNAGQTLTLVECPDDYDLISFNENIYDIVSIQSRQSFGKRQKVFFRDNIATFDESEEFSIDDKLIVVKEG